MNLLNEKLLFALVLSLVSLAVQAALEVDITVTASVSPDACDVSVEKATMDFGKIQWTQEGRDSVAPLYNSFTLMCADPSMAVVELTHDNSKIAILDLGSDYAVGEVTTHNDQATSGTGKDVAWWVTSKDPSVDPGEVSGGPHLAYSGMYFGTVNSDRVLTPSTGFTMPFDVKLVFPENAQELPAPTDVERLKGLVTLSVRYH